MNRKTRKILKGYFRNYSSNQRRSKEAADIYSVRVGIDYTKISVKGSGSNSLESKIVNAIYHSERFEKMCLVVYKTKEAFRFSEDFSKVIKDSLMNGKLTYYNCLDYGYTPATLFRYENKILSVAKNYAVLYGLIEGSAEDLFDGLEDDKFFDETL